MELATETRYTSRPYGGDSDLQPICEMLNLCSDVGDLDDTHVADDLRLEITGPGTDMQRDIRIWEDTGGRIVAYGRLYVPETDENFTGHLYFRVHPEHRHDGIEGELVAWGSDRIKEVAGERGLTAKLHAGVREHDAYSRQVLEEHGFGIVRYFFRMVRPLDVPIPEPKFPEGFTLTHSRGQEDAERWVDMFNQSFIDHWNHHPETVESFKHWLGSAKYKPERDLIAVAPDGTFAAFCFCWIDPDDNERHNRKEGWIDILGTRRGFRRIGLGRAMLLAGMHLLKAEGMEKAKLGVDAENPTGALGLYESVDFEKDQKGIAYSKELQR